MSSQTKFQAMSTLDSYLYARYERGGPTSQVWNLSWTIVFLMKQVPHKSCELDMRTSHHPHMHGLWTHEGGGNRPESPRGVFDENPFCGTTWSRAVTGI